MNIAYLSIGSNIENRIKNCMLAIDELSAFLIIKKISSFYETAPMGVENQNSFINCAIKIETSLTPRDLLIYLSETEKKLGRNNKGDYKPRAIDLDIIFYNDLVLNTLDLTIPHKNAHLRRFVIEPLCEIDPDLMHPVLNKSVIEIMNAMEINQKVEKIGNFYDKIR